MAPGLLLSTAIAGAVLVLTPGPAKHRLIGIGAARGRGAAAGFLLGHLVGDLFRALLALLVLAWTGTLSPAFFHALALICGFYLLLLGARAVLAMPDETGSGAVPTVRRPVRNGLITGLIDPKCYPVTVTVFTALLGDGLRGLDKVEAAALPAVCLAGFLIAGGILIWLVGLPAPRAFYRSREIWLVRATGVMYAVFAVCTMVRTV